jgi:hypothetical protein
MNKGRAIIPVEPTTGTDPGNTIFVLKNALNGIAAKAILHSQTRVLKGKLGSQIE